MATIEKTVTCIGCPLGCPVTATIEGDTVTAVRGNTCPRGEAYARTEVTHPMRIVTSTVRVRSGELPVVSVKTAAEIPKEKIRACMAALQPICVNAPVHEGQIILRNIAGTAVDIVATKDIAAV
jgi:CxxC motif-containing protein